MDLVGRLGAPSAEQGPLQLAGDAARLQLQPAELLPGKRLDSANPDGWWYRIVTSPWSGSDYLVTNTFMIGDAPGQSPAINMGWSVPVW
ncbi:hypothetical protein ACIPJK_36905 [Streptomyces roseus]|uniref:hypothetical protein n=1 Tax=Streptomyces roseus TaxID=66430 RepID=UPI0038050589